MRGASSARAGAAAGVLIAAGALAGCGGAGDEAATTSARMDPAPVAEVRVRVVDGDTGRPVAGAAVRARGAGGALIAATRADGRGRAEIPATAIHVTAASRRHDPARRRVRGPAVTIPVYDPALQSPEYGGGPTRDRYVPAVRVPPPRGAPAWTFDGRTLLEFPPAVDHGLVVVGTNAGRVFALGAKAGRLRWARRVRGNIASSPAIAGEVVYVTSMGGILAAYRRQDGKPLWRLDLGSPIESSPLVAKGLVYLGTHDGTLYAVDADAPRIRWRYRASGAIKGSAALAGGTLVVGDYAGAVHGVDARTGARRWVAAAGRRFYGGPAISGTTAVIGDVGGAVVALDTRTGAVRWRRSTGGAYVYATPAIAGDTVYIGSYNGRFEALALGTGAVRWSFDAGGRISGSATVVDGVVYTSILYRPGEPRRTYGLDARTGAVRFRMADGRYSPAVAAGRTLYLVGVRTLYAHPAPAA